MIEEVSTETFLKMETLFVLARSYPCKLETSNGNFKKCRNFARIVSS